MFNFTSFICSGVKFPWGTAIFTLVMFLNTSSTAEQINDDVLAQGKVLN